MSIVRRCPGRRFGPYLPSGVVSTVLPYKMTSSDVSILFGVDLVVTCQLPSDVVLIVLSYKTTLRSGVSLALVRKPDFRRGFIGSCYRTNLPSDVVRSCSTNLSSDVVSISSYKPPFRRCSILLYKPIYRCGSILLYKSTFRCGSILLYKPIFRCGVDLVVQTYLQMWCRSCCTNQLSEVARSCCTNIPSGVVSILLHKPTFTRGVDRVVVELIFIIVGRVARVAGLFAVLLRVPVGQAVTTLGPASAVLAIVSAQDCNKTKRCTGHTHI